MTTATVPFEIARDADGLIQFHRLSEPTTHPLRVLYVTNMWPDERREFFGPYIASQARSLVAEGLGVDVLYVRGFLDTKLYAKAMLTLPRMARDTTYDVIHAHYGHTLAAALGMRHAPMVISFCGEDLLGAPRGNGITRKSKYEVMVFRQLARIPAGTITKSAEMERVLPPSVQARNTVLPNGVDLERFSPGDQAAARAELGWEAGVPTVLFLGNVDDPRKNVALAREAVKLLSVRRPDVILKEIGGVDPSLVPTLYAAADVLVFPSLSEGSPNAIKEAMACELPIVAGPVGDIEERLTGVAGGFVREHAAPAFADALEEALEFGGTSTALREAVEPLGIQAIARRLIGIYGAAIARASRD